MQTNNLAYLARPDRIIAMGPKWLALALVFWAGAAQASPDFPDWPDMDEKSGYRIQNYRAPVKRPVEGGKRVETEEVDRLRNDGAVLVDVMPQRGGYDPATGAWRLVDKRETIPGAVWLPEVGRGAIEARIAAYFEGSLRRLTGGNVERPIVFFCLADCWMSWNAVRRAASLGYLRLYWYADGTDGWREADKPLEKARPPPVP